MAAAGSAPTTSAEQTVFEQRTGIADAIDTFERACRVRVERDVLAVIPATVSDYFDDLTVHVDEAGKKAVTCSLYLCTHSESYNNERFEQKVRVHGINSYRSRMFLDGSRGSVPLELTYVTTEVRDFIGAIPTDVVRGLEATQSALQWLAYFWAGTSTFKSIEELAQAAVDKKPEIVIRRKRVIGDPPGEVVWEDEDLSPPIKCARKEGPDRVD